MLEIQNLTAEIAGKTILENISVQLQPGTTTALLGPNGSGKSTLGNALLGAPFVKISEDSCIFFRGEDVTLLPTHARVEKGLFMTFQSPLPLSGVSVLDVLRAALVTGNNKKYSASELHTLATRYAEELKIPKEFLRRSLYEGFSGGEKKKMEALQAVIFQPRAVIFDELDTGVDVDALKTITRFLQKNLPRETACVFITHSPKLLSLYHPDEVIVLKNGRIVKKGGKALADEIEKDGFENL